MHFKKFVGVFLIVTIIEEGPLTFRQEPGVPDFLPSQGSVQREEGPESWAQVLSMSSKMKPECMLPTRWVAKRFFSMILSPPLTHMEQRNYFVHTLTNNKQTGAHL